MKTLKLAAVLWVGVAGCAWGQAATAPKTQDAWQSLAFLEGTWSAANTQGPAGAAVSETGTYTFRPELGGHVLARHGHVDACKAPNSFDCDHGDLLYVYRDAANGPMKAIYFDSEGHVLHYDVTTPSPTSVVFLSDPAQPGPQFRLSYELKGGVMSGKFQMHMPGQTEWRSYLEWSGPKV